MTQMRESSLDFNGLETGDAETHPKLQRCSEVGLLLVHSIP